MNPRQQTIFRARYIFVDGQMTSDVAVVEQGGQVVEVIADKAARHRIDGGAQAVECGDAALLPGQINIHSHAFQRAMRGRTEYRQAAHGDDDFWSWRREMYDLANRIEPAHMEIIARMAFMEMLRCGITHVGEFHYLHHDRDGRPFDEPNEMAHRIARAADEVGIRLTLLPVAYHTGDIGEPAREGQRRFVHQEVDAYLDAVRRLADRFSGRQRFNIGLAPHSIRAVPRDWMEAISAAAKQMEMPVHIHVCEQRKEVATSRQQYGLPPVEALHDWGVLDDRWTLIHGTHLSERELEILEAVRPTIGACPSTERNLGDGFLPARQLVARDIPIALGSDSHTMIAPFEEMRLVEYHERLRAEERNTLVGVDPQGRTSTADILWPMGTRHGVRSLHAAGGEIAPGEPADMVAIDLGHPSVAGASAGRLLSDVVLSMSSAAVRDVMVAGQSVVEGRRHRNEADIIDQYRTLMATYRAR